MTVEVCLFRAGTTIAAALDMAAKKKSPSYQLGWSRDVQYVVSYAVPERVDVMATEPFRATDKRSTLA